MSMKSIAVTSLACVLFAGSLSTLAAPTQDGTARPGLSTQARVWVENRGAAEAIPVSLQPSGSGALPVVVTGTPPTSISGVVQTRVSRVPWEYRTVVIATGQDAAALLNAAGAEGWEMTGLAIATQTGATVVMKRPRQ
jgi:hypothetical protein